MVYVYEIFIKVYSHLKHYVKLYILLIFLFPTNYITRTIFIIIVNNKIFIPLLIYHFFITCVLT